jgi:hypothetical protein
VARNRGLSLRCGQPRSARPKKRVKVPSACRLLASDATESYTRCGIGGYVTTVMFS